jgi:hypothetical protein
MGERYTALAFARQVEGKSPLIVNSKNSDEPEAVIRFMKETDKSA